MKQNHRKPLKIYRNPYKKTTKERTESAAKEPPAPNRSLPSAFPWLPAAGGFQWLKVLYEQRVLEVP